MSVEADILSEVIRAVGYHRHAPEFGERAWIAEGKEFDVVYWDEGNGWCAILLVVPHGDKVAIKKGTSFYRKLDRRLEKSYDEDGYRID